MSDWTKEDERIIRAMQSMHGLTMRERSVLGMALNEIARLEVDNAKLLRKELLECRTCGCSGTMQLEQLDGDGHAVGPDIEVTCRECDGLGVGGMGQLLLEERVEGAQAMQKRAAQLLDERAKVNREAAKVSLVRKRSGWQTSDQRAQAQRYRLLADECAGAAAEIRALDPAEPPP